MPLCSDPPSGLPAHTHSKWQRLVDSDDLVPILAFKPAAAPLLPASREPRQNPGVARSAQDWFNNLPDDTAKSIVNLRRAQLYQHTAQVMPYARPARHPGPPPPELLDTLSALAKDKKDHRYHQAGEKVRSTLGMPSAGMPANLTPHEAAMLTHSPYTGLSPDELQMLHASTLMQPPPAHQQTGTQGSGSWLRGFFKPKPGPGQHPGVLGLGYTHPTVVGMPLPPPGQPMPPPGMSEIPQAPEETLQKPEKYDFDPRDYPGNEPEGPQPWYETLGAFTNMNYKWNKLDVQPKTDKTNSGEPDGPVFIAGTVPVALRQGPVGPAAPTPGVMPGEHHPFVPSIPPHMLPPGAQHTAIPTPQLPMPPPGPYVPSNMPPVLSPTPPQLGPPLGAPWMNQQYLETAQLWQRQGGYGDWQGHPGVTQGTYLNREVAAMHGEVQRFPAYPTSSQPGYNTIQQTQYLPQATAYPPQQQQTNYQTQYPPQTGPYAPQQPYPQNAPYPGQQQYGAYAGQYPPPQQGQYMSPQNQYLQVPQQYQQGGAQPYQQGAQQYPYAQDPRGPGPQQQYPYASGQGGQYGRYPNDQGGYGLDKEPVAGKGGKQGGGFGLDAEDIAGAKPLPTRTLGDNKGPVSSRDQYGLDADINKGPKSSSQLPALSRDKAGFGIDSELPSISGNVAHRPASPAPGLRKDTPPPLTTPGSPRTGSSSNYGLSAETGPVRSSSPAPHAHGSGGGDRPPLGGGLKTGIASSPRDDPGTPRGGKPAGGGGFGLDSEADPPSSGPRILPPRANRDSDSGDDLASQRAAIKAKAALSSPAKEPVKIGSPTSTLRDSPSKPAVLPSTKGRDSDLGDKPILPSDRKPLGFSSSVASSKASTGFGLDTESKKVGADQGRSSSSTGAAAAKPALKSAAKPSFGLGAEDDF